MRKIMISVILLLWLSTYAHAQKVNFGIKGGMNLSDVSGGSSNTRNMFNFHAGGIVEFVFRRGLFGVQPELLYSRQGSARGNFYKTKLDYVSVPIMLKFFPFEKLSLDIGPQTSFLLNYKEGNSEEPETIKDSGASKIDLGLNIGFGYNLDRQLFAQARYNLGITKVYGNLNNSVIQVSIGYKF